MLTGRGVMLASECRRHARDAVRNERGDMRAALTSPGREPHFACADRADPAAPAATPAVWVALEEEDPLLGAATSGLAL